jgi:hypothetical protein
VVAAWAGQRGRARCQRGNGPLERHRCHRLAPGNGAGGTAAWSDSALLHLACMQMLSVIVPPALAAAAQSIYGGVAVGR